MGDVFGPEFIDDGSFDPDSVGGEGREGREGGIRATQTVNQNQGQGQNQGQQQQQAQPERAEREERPESRFGAEDTLGLHQRATATNQNVIVGNSGSVTTGTQSANAVNVAAAALGLACPNTSLDLPATATATSVSYSSNPSTGYMTHVIVTPEFTVTIETPPGVGTLPTVTVS